MGRQEVSPDDAEEQSESELEHIICLVSRMSGLGCVRMNGA